MNRCYWTFGIVPVQDWIEAARRSVDLRFGSVFLAWTTTRVVNQLRRHAQHSGLKLEVLLPRLMPNMETVETVSNMSLDQALTATQFGFPNRVTGLVEGMTLTELSDALSQASQQLALTWQMALEKAKKTARHSFDSKIRREIENALSATKSPFQLLWTAASVNSSGDDHCQGIDETDRLFAAAKRSRPYPQFPAGVERRKCSLCGTREAFGPIEGRSPHERWQNWRTFQQKLEDSTSVQRGIRLSVGERLCGVCLCKRLASYGLAQNFPSTSAIAARDWQETAKSLTAKDPYWSVLAKVATETQQDPEVFLFQRSRAWMECQVSDENSDPAESCLPACWQELREGRRRIGQIASEGLGTELHEWTNEPCSYLAVLMFDGDDLGTKTREHLAELPFADDFASKIKPRIEAHHAEAFYLGGDEGLILAPLGTALELAFDLHDCWQDTWKVDDGALATVSMGIAVFDREQPLGEALCSAREALGKSKQFCRYRSHPKDALAFSVVTASGSSWTTVDAWDGIWDLVRAVKKDLLSEAVSMSWVYDAERTLLALLEGRSGTEDGIREYLRLEMLRRLRRQSDKTKNTATEAELRRLWTETQPEKLSDVTSGLRLSAFLARHAIMRVSEFQLKDTSS